jgi:OPA family sugar phosphate sensor protein UhpC-like MFS transporter
MYVYMYMNIHMYISIQEYTYIYTYLYIGNISTSFSIAYGISKFVGGVVSDFLPADILFSAGLFLAALSNLLFSFSLNINVLCFLWSVNGLIQGKYTIH